MLDDTETLPKINIVDETPDVDRWAELDERFTLPFPPKPHQRDTLNSYGHMDRHGYWWKPGCVDSETEFLNQHGVWKRMDQYSPGVDMVTQWEPDHQRQELVWPSAYHQPTWRRAIKITAEGVDQLLTLDHNVYLHGHVPHNPPTKTQASSLHEWHNTLKAWEKHLPRHRRTTDTVYLPTLVDGRVVKVPINKVEKMPGAIKEVEYSTPQTFYCFTVPSGLLVLRRNNCIFITGNCGKTFGTAVHALYLAHKSKTKQWIVLMPPIVLRNWSRFLDKIVDKTTGRPIKHVLYAGSPTQRKKLDLNATFILMSYDIFKRDFDRLEQHFWDLRVGLIADEAHKVKNMQTQTYKAIWRMFSARPVLLASGTPISSPEDAYTYMKFTFPGRYRNKREFENLHVLERDDYEKVVRWQNLQYMHEGFCVNATQYTAEQVRSDAAPVNFIPLVYDLEPGHLKLYNELVTQQMLELEDGTVIDALTASALYHRCQQIVLNWGVFADDESRVANGIELAEEVLDEIGDEKLLIVANYRMTTTMLNTLLARYNPAMIIGGLSDKQRYAQVDKFTLDKTCRVLIIQPEAGGVGLDGLQAVCNEALFLECPTIPRQFEQAFARLAREGQTRQVNCRIAVANKTIQVRLHKNLLEKDDTIRQVTGSLKSLREAIHGN